MPAKSARTVEIVRLANPWMVGRYVDRIVPVFALHNLIAPDFERHERTKAIKDLAFSASIAKDALGSDLTVTPDEYADIEATAFGVLSPDRRIFSSKKGGASEVGSLFPVVAGLVASEPGDDGMGKRLRSLLKRHKGAWQQDLVQLFAPDDVKDPVTAFACRLLGGKAGDPSLEEISRDVEPLSGIDAACANFMINLMQQGPADSRIACIRRLAIGAFFAGTMRLVSGVVTNSGSKFPPAVFVYCGLPPGIPQDPLVRAAGKSFAAWIQNSHSATIKKLSSTLSVVECLPKTPAEERFRQQLQIALHDSLGTSSDVEEIIKHVTPALSREGVSFESCKQLLESREVGFTKSELTRRVRSLGSHIGFAGPTRGLLPRLLVDTPLLGVLTRGVVGSGTMSFDDFVTRLHTEFGIVVGLGADDSVADALGDLGTEGFDTYEMLITNQQLLRERMIRTGLARTYSDSHTEVFSNV